MRHMSLRPTASLAVLLAVVLSACAGPAREPWPTDSGSPTPTASPTAMRFALSPVPAELTVPVGVSALTWVAPLTGADIDALAPAAAVQVQYRNGSDTDSMVANVLWFTIARYNALMAAVDAPKGIEMGVVDGHVLFVQPALDMPFDPASGDAKAYGTLVVTVRDFASYSMRDPALTLLRPCPVMDEWPTEPVTPAIRQAVTAYFTAKELTPVTIQDDKAWVLDVAAQSKGTHVCANPDGGTGGYVGAVPAGALEAVMVYTHHKAYPVTGAASTFLTLARTSTKGWTVVSEGTGP